MKTGKQPKADVRLPDARRSPGGLHSPHASTGRPSEAKGTRDERVSPPDQDFSPAQLNAALIHFYRGELVRSNTWRVRLDTTTNWAVITAAGTLSFAFSSPNNPHFLILLNSLLVAVFLFMEARRYRYYEIWARHVRIIETGHFARLLRANGTAKKDLAEYLSDDLLTPRFTINELEAVGRRLRRTYLWILALLAVSWNLKVYLHPQPAYDFAEFVGRAAVGRVPGWALILMGIIFNAGVFAFAFGTLRLRETTSEVLR